MRTTDIPRAWKNSKRLDLSNAQKMIDLGFEVEYHTYDFREKRFDNPNFPIIFVKGNTYVWKTMRWITAELIDGHFCNHVTFNTIADVMHRILSHLEMDFYDSIRKVYRMKYFVHEPCSGSSWLTNIKDDGKDKDRYMIYVNATWNFDGEVDGIEVTFRDGEDELRDGLPKNKFYKFPQPTNLLELANFKQFYVNILESLIDLYLVKSK